MVTKIKDLIEEVKMKFTIGIAVILVLAFASFLSVRSFDSKPTLQPVVDSNMTPELVVREYYAYSEKGDFESIKKLLTYNPDEYYQSEYKRIDLLKKANGTEVVKVKKKEEAKDGRIRLVRAGAGEPNTNISGVVSDLVPNRIYSFRLYIERIDQIWIKGNEAKVQVVLTSKNSDTYRGKENVYLYLRDGEWKIFHVFSPLDNEQYAQ